jgi:putative ABC transport system permease protein
MLITYFKIAWRSFVKNKVYSGINLVGLAIGIAGAIVVFQLVTYHLSVDRYHSFSDRTYRVVVDLHLDDGSVEKEKGSAYVLHQTLKKEFSPVEHATYLAHKEVTLAVDLGQKKELFLEKEAAGFTNSDWFAIFDYEWVVGQPSVLDAPNQVVLTEKYARKYFGPTNPVGKYMTINNQENLLVAGLLKDLPEVTDQRTEVFISLPTLKTILPSYGYEDWGWIDSSRETYITLRSARDKAAFEKQMPAFAKKYYGEIGHVFRYHLQPLSEVHFDEDYGGKIKYSTIVMLGTVGLLLIFIACFNFINLTIAQSLKRSKEVGVRKILGVSQRQIFWFFIQETALYTLLACIFALLISPLDADPNS